MEDDGTEIIEGQEGFDEEKWYSYTAQTEATTNGGTSKWANAVTISEGGTIIGYFVWIPRYAYRIVYFDTPEHKEAYRQTGATDGIIGYSDARGFVHSDGTTPSNMETPVVSIAVGTNKLRPHPAFEDGTNSDYTQGEWNTALEGIWIAKYETSTGVKSVPGKLALGSRTIGDMYTMALNFNSINNSHMLKNSEWGAMAYFTDSKYGRNGTDVTSNGENCYTAGASGATVKTNPLQSTTGNYYGIYDVAGGCYEYVTGYIATSLNTNGNSFAATNPSAADATNDKTTSTEYATVYDILSAEASLTSNYLINVNKKFGDAIIETSTGVGSTAWNSETSWFLGFNFSNKGFFFERGGYHGDSEDAGIFNFYFAKGDKITNKSFRLALSVI